MCEGVIFYNPLTINQLNKSKTLNMDNSEKIAQLKVLVAQKSGLDYIKPEDCKGLSEQIFIKTNNYLSEKTLNMFFVENRKEATPFILNCLAQFAGFGNWNQYFELES